MCPQCSGASVRQASLRVPGGAGGGDTLALLWRGCCVGVHRTRRMENKVSEKLRSSEAARNT